MKEKRKYKNLFNFLFFLFLLPIVIYLFYQINILNYGKHIEIKQNYVKHPEDLPNKEFAKDTSFGFKNLRADFYWLEIIQYIGSNVIQSEYKKYLYIMLDLITELNPYFEHPYIIGELLLPNYNERYEDLEKKEQEKYIDQSILIGKKGIRNFCDINKLEKIKNENNLTKIANNEEFQDPCKSYLIPYYLGYIYYFYKKDPITSAYYYKVTSAIEGVPEGAKTMAAIMEGKGGNREKSFFMFLNIANALGDDDKVCKEYSNLLEKYGSEIFYSNRNISGDNLRQIEKSREEYLGKFKEDDSLIDTKCVNYVNKAVRELNLYYLDKGNEKYFKNNDQFYAFSPKTLFDEGYIDYIPIDFQQYDNYGIIYTFNTDIKRFDYEMGYPEDN